MDPRASRWKALPFQVGAPRPLYPWLRDAGSLTARLSARCTSFRVRVLRQARAAPNIDECALLGLPPRAGAWLREVLLLADGQAAVFAHTVLAPRQLRGAWHMAAGMGGRPLGAALFADPRIRRGRLEFARLTAAHPLHRRATAALGMPLPTLWARRSCFRRHGQPLLVSEVFLPAIRHLDGA